MLCIASLRVWFENLTDKRATSLIREIELYEFKLNHKQPKTFVVRNIIAQLIIVQLSDGQRKFDRVARTLTI